MRKEAILDSDHVREGVQLLIPLLEHWEAPQKLTEKLFDSLTSLIAAKYSYATASLRADRYREIFYFQRPEGFEQPAAYTSMLYMLDPLRPKVMNQDFGVHPLAQNMPDGFEDSEYYRLVYESSSIVDEMIFVLPLGLQAESDSDAEENTMGTLVIGLARSTEEGKFSAQDIKKANALYPVLASCATQIVVDPLANEALQERRTDPNELYELLQGFVEDKLTAREGQVITLVLCGHNTESVSVQLGIACDTVKLHRKHSYAKLKVNSQGELFKLFLDFIANATETGEATVPTLRSLPAREAT